MLYSDKKTFKMSTSKYNLYYEKMSRTCTVTKRKLFNAPKTCSTVSTVLLITHQINT